jgi:hypothetical protein
MLLFYTYNPAQGLACDRWIDDEWMDGWMDGLIDGGMNCAQTVSSITGASPFPH